MPALALQTVLMFCYNPTTASCDHYYQCTGGTSYNRMSCPGGLQFDLTLQRCDWPTVVTCFTGPTSCTTSTESLTTSTMIFTTEDITSTSTESISTSTTEHHSPIMVSHAVQCDQNRTIKDWQKTRYLGLKCSVFHNLTPYTAKNGYCWRKKKSKLWNFMKKLLNFFIIQWSINIVLCI